MRRKKIPAPDTVVSPEILEQAKETLPEKAPQTAKCVVCGSECAANSSEELCWVCRRLKISAWHESEQQMPAQE